MIPVQTVQLQCGNCSNMMAISVEHLGAQVQCPHCAAVVQTPPRSSVEPGPDPAGMAPPPPAPPPPPPPQYQPPQFQPSVPVIEVAERESIFSDPEPSDDLFGGSSGPTVQMPEPAAAPQHYHQSVAVAEEPEEEQADLSAMRNRMAQERKSSGFAPTLLVFLVPYAIFTTGFIAYLLMTYPTIEALGVLMDPNLKNKPKTVSLPVRNSPVPKSLKTSLNKPITVGQMEFTPLKISRDGDVLTLKFKAKNLSKNLVIDPIEPMFFDEKVVGAGYTFLEPLNKEAFDKVSGGDLAFFNDKNAAIGDRDLLPGHECTIEISTSVAPTAKTQVRNLLAQNGRFQWRLQVRRGVETVYGVPTSLTAVIGIEFDKSNIAGL